MKVRNLAWLVSFIALTGIFFGCPNDGDIEEYVGKMPAKPGTVTRGLSVSPGIVTVKRGSVQTFTATLSSDGNAAGDVKWTVYGATGESGTNISDGVLTVDASEEAVKLTVKAEAGGKYGTAIMYVIDNGGSPPDLGKHPSNLGLLVKPVELTLDREDISEIFTAINSNGEPVEDVKWSLIGATDSSFVTGTQVKIGANESAEKILVKAEKGLDSGEAVIAVRGNESIPVVINSGVSIEPSTASVAPGGEMTFRAVDGESGKPAAVTWRVLGAGKSGTKVNSTGKLEVAENETASLISLWAETSDGRYGAAAITTSPLTVTVEPATISIIPGREQQFTATVTGTRYIPKTVRWELIGDGRHSQTKIDSKTGLLTVHMAEKSRLLTVRAVSDGDPEKYADAVVNIKDGVLYVAVAFRSNNAAYSFDGITWTGTTMPESAEWCSVVYGGGRFVALSGKEEKAAYSTDGIIWTMATRPPSCHTSYWRALTYDGSKFVALVNDSYRMTYSTDGVIWMTRDNLPSNDSWWRAKYGGGKVVAIAGSGSDRTDKAAYSINGVDWIETTLPYKITWYSLTYGDGRFVALAHGSDSAAYSTDGIAWYAANRMPSSGYWLSVAYGGGKFVALASDSNSTAYSTNGENWTDGPKMPESAPWRRIVYGGNKFVVITTGTIYNTNKAAYSDDDGLSWQATTLPDSDHWFDLAVRTD
jgi:hypothetical protein